jgi:elongation factor Ts
MLEREVEIAKEQSRAEGKPEEMLEKIAQGKIQKFYKESTLLNQEFIKDNKLSVGQYLKNQNKDLTVTAFSRVSLA